MKTLEFYSAEWKKIDGKASALDSNLFEQKNKTIMQNLEKFEKKERQELIAAISSAGTSIILATLLSIGLPIKLGITELNVYSIIGAVLMLVSLFLFAKILRGNKINFNCGQPTLQFLQNAKEKLLLKKATGMRAAKMYGIFLISGLCFLYAGFMNPSSIYFGIGLSFAILAFLVSVKLWKKSFENSKQIKIDLLTKEIDSMLLGLS